MHGSKVQLGKRYFDQGVIPKVAKSWIEPFAGRGNMFFTFIHYGGICDNYQLNDLNMADWLKSLRDYAGDYEFVNESPITTDDYKWWMNQPESIEKHLAESFIVRHGNKWGGGPNTSSLYRGGNCHNREHTIARLRTAKKYLEETPGKIVQGDYSDFLENIDSIHPDDFVYFDPPYNSGGKVFYDNINHQEMLAFAKSLNCRVAISGYESDLYFEQLKNWSTINNVHHLTVRKIVDGKKPKINELLWCNYNLNTHTKA